MRRDSRAPVRGAPGAVSPGAHRAGGEARHAEAVLNPESPAGGGPDEPFSLAWRTALFFPPSAALHDTGWGHPEHQGRARAITSALESAFPELHGRVRACTAPPAERRQLLEVHSADHLDRVERASAEARRTGRQVLCGEETPLSGASWDAILESSGAAITAVLDVAAGRARNAFVVSRPPGHHASSARAMGFCPVNHVAVAARALQASDREEVERILIVDWDVHHGNGTQDIFWKDGSVYYLSIHQAPFYPGTGASNERGEGPGAGRTRNVPVPAGLPREEYLGTFEEALRRAEAEFEPDFVLVSAGYDALAGDPLGALTLEPEDFAALTRTVVQLADRACGGRIVACLEGGYHPKRTAEAVVRTLQALADSSST